MINDLRKEINLVVEGIENYPKDAPSVIITNHNQLMDIFYVPAAIDDYIVSLISARLVYKKDIERLKMVNKYLNAFPIEAHGGKIYSNMCIEHASKILDSGISLSIFPEGAYIDDKNNVYRGRTGAARILINQLINGKHAYFLPVSLDVDSNKDLDSYMPNKDDMIHAKILEPVNTLEYYYDYVNSHNLEDRNTILHELTDNGMKKIAESLNRNYVNEYIELFPKGNVIFSDGEKIDKDLAQNKIYIERYEKDLEVLTKKLVKNKKSGI